MRIRDFPEDHGERRGLIDVRRMPTSQLGFGLPAIWYFRLQVDSRSMRDIRIRAVGDWVLSQQSEEHLLYEIASQMLVAGACDPWARLPDGRLLAAVAAIDLYA